MGKIAGQGKARSKPVEELGKIEAIQSDVASFAASLGLAAGAGVSSGFNDSDFRKVGSIRKPEQPKQAVVEKKKKATETGKSAARKDDKGIRSGKTRRVDADRKQGSKENAGGNNRGKRLANGLEGKDANGPGDKSPGGWKAKENHANPKKRKGSWEVGADGESEVKRPLVETPYGEPEFVKKLRSEAQDLLEKAANDFEKNRSRDKDAEWLLKARRSGTSADKVAAMTVILQENPKANVRTLDALLGMMTSKAGKRHAATGIDALKELFLYNLLPDRKLKYFAQQPLATLPEGKERSSLLLDWIWEDCLKHRFERFVISLDEASKDKLPFLKEKALKSVYELLKTKPEQERRLLSTLVNKLGDPERKVASNACYLLSSLLTAHPNMKKIVVDEVDGFVFRPHVGLRARYYATVFLNQIVLSVKGDGPKLAKQLIDLYFALFKAVTTGEQDLNKEENGKKGTKGEKERVRRGKRKERNNDKSLAADFTTEIDSRLLSALLTGVNRAFPYISAEDLDTVTQENSVLFRLVHSTNFNVAVQALMLLHQLMVKNQAVNDRFYRALYSVLLSESLAKSSKAEMFLGLIFKALKSDVDVRRMSAIAKRLTQVAIQQTPEFACASLFLISEILKLKPTLWNSVLNAEDHDDDREHFEDQGEESDDNERGNTEKANGHKEDSQDSGDTWPEKGYYDPKARDPLYCQAHRACWWELTVLAKHVHPSVAAMARTLLSGGNIIYSGDPLRDLALGVFLDRFVEKKPKATKRKTEGTWHGSSMALPAKLDGAKSAGPVGEDILKLAEEDVAPEDVVFHKFYSTKSIRSKPQKKKKSKVNSEEDVLGLDEVAAFDGDDSENEEIDELLEQEAGEEMMADDSEGEEMESDDEEMLYYKKDEDDDHDLESDVEEGDSEGDEANALLEDGLEMSSSDGEEIESEEDEMGSEEEDFLPKKGKKQSAGRQSSKKRASVFQEAEDSDGEVVGVEDEDMLPRKQRLQTPARGPAKKRASPFQEQEDSDFDVASEADSALRKRNKKIVKRRLSVFQEAGSDSDDAGLIKLSGRNQRSINRIGKNSGAQAVSASRSKKIRSNRKM
ncbi:ribosome biogenesis protein MAK21 [Marchantia polymorpha subsp. ruderalis]|uniref:CCAAT-binding factor domain-containing protein n=2 Tax=Marchantia polymorpha TaxID=3197 RepID=A0AAF6AR23_MARPO|nr:hypothetical protein MARPO_0001s0039 [Marchantia polymorpha]BBM98893.1 hypothetical protein Mp_1g16990 [Marchantia polymorpha subsp. ruderalis]|eukprot:PTQ49969.1 hypothetical protein MARPO_0001s0039 [Marchantia polymorpha]